MTFVVPPEMSGRMVFALKQRICDTFLSSVTNGKDGLLVPSKDPAALAAIDRVIEGTTIYGGN